MEEVSAALRHHMDTSCSALCGGGDTGEVRAGVAAQGIMCDIRALQKINTFYDECVDRVFEQTEDEDERWERAARILSPRGRGRAGQGGTRQNIVCPGPHAGQY